MDQEERVKSLDAEITRITKSTRTTVPAILSLHDILRQKYSWYYKWHLNPYSSKIHLLILVLSVIGIGAGLYFNLFGSPKITKAAPASVGTTTNSTSLGITYQKRVIYDSVNSVYWAFWHNGTAIAYAYSADGVTWTTSSTLAENTINFSLWTDGSTVYLASLVTSADVKVRKGTMAASSITWGSPVTITAGGYYTSINIILDTNKRVWAIYSQDDGFGAHPVFYKRSTNPSDITTWGTEVQADTDSGTQVAIVPLASGDMYAIWGGPANSLYAKKYTAGTGLWSVRATVISNTSAWDGSIVSDANTQMHMAYKDGTSVKYMNYSSGAWQAAVTLGTGNIPGISIDTATNNLYTYYVNTNTIQYKKGVSPYASGNWDTNPTTIYSTGTNTYPSVSYNTTGSKAFLIWMNGVASPYNIYFDNSVATSSGPVTRYWINNTTGNWNDTANWSATSGGAGGATVPIAGDTAVFDNAGSTHNGALTINATVNVGTLDFQAAYTGAITQGANTITTTTAMNLNGTNLTAGADITASGTLTTGSGKTLDINGHNITVTGVFTNNGTLKQTGDETTVNLTNDTAHGTIEYSATSLTRNIRNWTYYSLKINGSGGTFRLPATATTTVNGSLDVTAGTLTTNDGTLDRNLNVTGATTVAGTFTANASTITLSGNWNSSAGTLNANTSTVTMTNTGTIDATYSTAGAFNNLTLNPGAGKTITMNTHFRVVGILTLQSGTLNGAVAGKVIDIVNPTATAYSNTGMAFGANIPTVEMFMSGASSLVPTIIPGGINTTYPNLVFYGLINSATGYGKLNGDLTVNGNVSIASLYAIGTGYVDTNNFNITATSSYTQIGWGGTQVGTLKFTGTSIFSTSSLIINAGSGAWHNTVDAGTGSISIALTYANSDTFTAGSSTVTFTKTSGTQTLNSGGTGAGQAFNNLTHSGAGTLQLLTNNIQINGNFLNSGGIFTTTDGISRNVTVNGNFTVNGASTVTANTSTFTVAGNWDHSAGTFTYGTSTIVMTGAAPSFNTGGVSGGKYVYNLTYTVAGGTMTLSAYTGIYGTLTVGSTSGAKATITGSYMYYYNATTPVTFNGTYNGTPGYNISGSTSVFRPSAAGNVTAGTYGNVDFSAAGSYTLSLQGDVTSTSSSQIYDTSVATSTLDLNGHNLTLAGTLSVGASWAQTIYGSLINTGVSDSTVSCGNLNIYASDASGTNQILANGTKTINFTVAGNWVNSDTFTAGASTVTFNKPSLAQTLDSGGTAAAYTFNNLTHSGAGTLQLTGNNLNIDGNFTNSAGTFDANSIPITVAGNWNNTGGTYSDGLVPTSITFDGVGAQTITAGGTGAGHTPKNLTVTNASVSGVTFADSLTLAASGTFTDNTGDSHLTFHAGSTYTFPNLTLNGTSGHNIIIRSSSAASTWALNITNAPTLTYVDAQDSNAAGGALITANTSNDSGNNTNWTFGGGVTYISGTVYTNENKSTTVGAGITVALSVNGGAKNTTTTIAGGVFSFNSVGVAANNTLTFFTDDVTNKSNLVTQVLNTTNDITGLEMYTGDISLRHETAGPMTNTLLATAATLADPNMFFSVATGNATFNKKLWLESGFNYTPGGQVIDISDLEVRGTATFAPAANAVSVSGNWVMSATGTFTTSGTITFNKGSSTQTLVSGGKAFSGLTHSGAGILQLVTNDLTANGTFTNSASTFDSNNLNMIFAGDWNNTGSATFTRGSGTMTFSGTSIITNSSSAAASLGAVAISGTATLGSNLTMTSSSGAGTLNLGAGSYNLTLTDTSTPLGVTTFQKGTGSTVIYTGTMTGTTIAAVQYNNLTITPTGATTYSLAGHLNTVNSRNLTGTLTINNYATLTTTASNYNIDCANLILNNGSTLTANASTLSTSSNLTVAGGTLTATSATLDINGDYSMTSGTTTMPSGITTVAGSWSITNGTFNNSNGTITLDGGGVGKTFVSGYKTYKYITVNSFDGTGVWTLMTNDLWYYTTVTITAGTLNTGSRGLGGMAISTNGITINGASGSLIGGSGSIEVGFDVGSSLNISNGSFTAGSGGVTIGYAAGGLSTYVHSGGTVDWTTNSSALNLYNNTTMTLPADTYYNLTLGSSISGATYSMAGDTSINNNLTINASTILDTTVFNRNLTVGGNYSNSGTFTAGTGTVTFNKTTGTQTLNSGGTGTGKLFNNLAHSGAGTLQLITNAIDIDGNLTNSVGTLDANGLNINVAKDWNISGGSFSAGATPGTQTVTFDSTNVATISGSTTFNNLTMDANTDGTKQINFTAGTTQTISSGKTWTLNGALGKVLTLRSTTPDSPWYFVISADMTSGSYIDVKDSQNITNAYRITPGSNVTDSGNNFPGWLLVPSSPTIGTPQAISTTTIRWTFTDNSSTETGFKVYDAANNLKATCASPNLTYCDETGLSVNTQYSGRYVVSYNPGGNSPHSGTAASIYTLANTPLAPTVNQISSTNLQVIINTNLNPVSTQFAIYNNTLGQYVQPDGTNNSTIVWQDYATWGGATGVSNTNLIYSTAYTYQVKARNGDNTETALSTENTQFTLSPGTGSKTSPSPKVSSSVTPTLTPSGEVISSPTPIGGVSASPTAQKDTQAPTAPSNLRATKLGAITLTLAWDASRDDIGVKGYDIYNAQTGIKVGTTTNTSFDFSGLTPNTVYKFYVRAFDSVPYYSPNSEVAELTTSSSKTEEEKTIEKQGGIAAFLILGNMPKEASVGQPFGNKVKVTVADVGGSIVKGYAKAVYFTSSDALAQLSYNEAHPYTFTAADAGVHEFASTDFVLNTGGRQQLTISDNSVKSTVEIKVNSTVATVLQQSAIYVEGFFNNPEQISHINLAVAVLIASALLMPVLINGFSNLNNLWPLILYWFTYLSQILGLRRRRKTWGIVFNSQTGQPVPFALVKLLDKSGRLIELSISDNQGRYGLTPKHGIFTLKVSRADFVFPSESKTSIFYEKIYTDSEIKIVDANQSVAFNIPLDPHSRSTIILVLLSWLVKFNHLIQKVRLPLFVLGAIFSLTMVVINFIFLYVVFLAYCVFMIIFDVIRLSRATAAGTVSDVYSHPISGAIVRIYHKQDNHLVETDISNKHGRFKFKVQPGVYYLVATKPNYIDTKTHLMYLEKGQKKEAISSISIKLKKE